MTVLGQGVEYGWSMGPYESQATPFSVPIDLPQEANGPGLVQVFVLMAVTDAETGDERAHARTDPAYVSNAGVAGEAWFDEAAAAANVAHDLTSVLDEGEVLDAGLVGAEVSP